MKTSFIIGIIAFMLGIAFSEYSIKGKCQDVNEVILLFPYSIISCNIVSESEK